MGKTPRRYSGVVVKGEGIAGRDFNVPTANIGLKEDPKLEHGVYAVRVLKDGWEFPGALCWGVGDPSKFEVHLLNFSGDLIGKTLDIEIIEKVSELFSYASKERLRQKIQHDVQQVQKVFDKQNKLK